MSVSVSFLWPFDKSLLDNVNEIIDAKTEAKSFAIFNGEQVCLEFYPKKIILKNHEKVIKEYLLSHDSEIIEINNDTILNNSFSLKISKMGLSKECLIKIKNGSLHKTVYLPTMGEPLTFDENIDLDKIHKEYL